MLAKIQYTFLLFFFLQLPLLVQAQNTKIDSLKNLLEEELTDSSKIKIYNDLGWEYNFEDNAKSLFYAEKAYSLAEKTNSLIGKAYALNTMGIIHLNKTEYEEAASAFGKSRKLFDKTEDSHGKAICLNNLGLIHDYKGEYDKALDYYLQSLEISENANHPQDITMSLSNIGTIYYLKKEYDKALIYYEKCLKMDRKSNNPRSIAISLNNVALIHKINEDYGKALEYDMEAFQINKSIHDKKECIVNLINIAENYTSLNQFSQALDYLKEAEQLSEEMEDQFKLINVYESYIKTYKNTGEIQKAIDYSLKCLEIAQKKQTKLEISIAYQNLADLHQITQDYRKAFEFQSLYMAYKDSLMNENSQKNIQALELKRKESENKLLQKEKDIQTTESTIKSQLIENQKYTNLLLAFLLFISACFVYLILKAYLQKQKNYSLLEEKNTQINSQVESLNKSNKELEQARREIEELNLRLREKIGLKNKHLNDAVHKLEGYAFANSHLLRRPVANILGLIDILQHHNKHEDVYKEAFDKLLKSVEELDGVILKINKITGFENFDPE